MQYAVISTGGKQYLAQPGQQLVIESLAGEAGTELKFDQVLLYVDGESVNIGTPVVAGMVIAATIVEQGLGDKIRVFKYKSKSRYRRTTGHRQHLTVVRIHEFGGEAATKPVKKAAKATTKKDAPAAEVVA